jgi:hypothetical protein
MVKMIKILSNEELKTKNLKQLETYIKQLEKAGYSVDHAAMSKEDPESYMRKKIRHALNESPSKSKRKTKSAKRNSVKRKTKSAKRNSVKRKTKSAKRNSVKRKTKSVRKSRKVKSRKVKSRKVSSRTASSKRKVLTAQSRREELNKYPVKSSKGDLDLTTIAKKLNIKNLTKMNKEKIINAILEKEEPQEVVTVKKVSPKVSKRKPSELFSEEEPEEEEEEEPEEEEEEEEEPEEEEEEEEPEEEEEEEEEEPEEEEEEEEEEPEEKQKKVIYFTPKKSCKAELLKKNLADIIKILKKNGYDVASDVTKEEAADLMCEKYKIKCSDKNGYDCPNGKVCNVSTSPGICVNVNEVNPQIARLKYNGKEIIGSLEAIKQLQTKLALENPKYEKPAEKIQGHRRTGGEESHKQLLTKLEKIKKIKEILEKRGIVSRDKQLTEKQQTIAVQQLEKHNKTCDEDNDYNCGDGLVCDLATKPGICVEENKGITVKPSVYDYNGNKIVGSKNTIENMKNKLSEKCGDYNKSELLKTKIADLRKMLNEKGISNANVKKREDLVELYCKKSVSPSPRSAKHKKLLADAVKLSGKKAEDLKNKSDVELGRIIQKEKISEVIRDSSLSQREISERTKTIKLKTPKNKGEYVEALASALSQSPAKLNKFTLNELKEKYKVLQKMPEEEHQDDELFEEEEEEEPQHDELFEEEEEEEPEEEDEEEISVQQEKRPQIDVNSEQVENVLKEISGGKKTNIEELSQVQNAVLKCLGLVSA